MNIVESIKNDGVGVIATDTVYGIVARLLSPAAVEKLYRVKHGDIVRPVGTILIASAKQLRGIVSDEYIESASEYWPGPVSVILPVVGLEYAHKGLGSLAFRVPADEQLVEILEQTGPLTTSSANLPMQPTATTIEQAKECFGDQLDFYQDGGDLSNKAASKIIRILPDGGTEIIRN